MAMVHSGTGRSPVGRTTARRWLSRAGSLVAVGLVAGCGGGGSPTPPAPAPPAAASPSPSPSPSQPLTDAQIFSRPVLSRAYEQTQWVLRDSSGSGYRETAASVGAALARLDPSYVSGVIYLENQTPVTPAMAADYQTIRSAVLAKNPRVKFDVEISLNPNPPPPKQPFANAAAVVAMMTAVDAQLHPDGWWFDFYAPNAQTTWISSAATYAHAHGETIGGNVFGQTVPPNSDAVAFVDNIVAGSRYGFDFSTSEIAALKAASPSTILIGHLQSNAQNAPDTESCLYMQETEAERAAYLTYWASQQSVDGFTFEYPVFYPLCPGAYAYDPLQDVATDGSTLYDDLQTLIDRYNPAVSQ